ncbi:MAG: hypothetical protein QOE94_2624 [Mycobacterium sp.]|nr:hypothetical protein [Mycobacterium sp.]
MRPRRGDAGHGQAAAPRTATVTDHAQLQELSTVWQGGGHIADAAAAIAFVLPVPPSERRKVTDQYDVGQATMAMMTAATDLGIGTGHSSVGDQDKARAILGVPEGYQVPEQSLTGNTWAGGIITRAPASGEISTTLIPWRKRHTPNAAI